MALVAIIKDGDTTGTTRKFVGEWALDPKNKGSIPAGYILEDPAQASQYSAADNVAEAVGKRVKKNPVVTNEPIKEEEVIVLENPVLKQAEKSYEDITDDENVVHTPDLGAPDHEPEIENEDNEDTETEKAEETKVVKSDVATEVKPKRKYNRKK